MNRAAAARPGPRGRPARTVAALMLAMLVVQLAAQWCAWHCGAVDLLERAPFPSRADAATTPVLAAAPVAPAGSAVAALPSPNADAPAASSDASTPCGAEAWCELGQTPPLGAPVRPVVAHAASAPGPAPAAPVVAFLSSPEERPPTA